MSKIYDCIIVGGGYAGMVLAIRLKRNQKEVLLIEQNPILGKKILSTGNGRCNFTNQSMDTSYFYSESDLSQINFDYKESLNFINELGVIEKNTNGYFYPYTNQAKTVREAFASAISGLKIECLLETRVTDVKKQDVFVVSTASKAYKARNVAIATGGLAASALGSTGDGYNFAKSLGIKLTQLRPALVGLKSNDPKLKTIAGVRTQGLVTIEDMTCEGEIQFNKDSISGYPVMCISRFALSTNATVKVNFVPLFNSFKLREALQKRIENNNCLYLTELLNGFLNDKVIQLVLKESNLGTNTKVCEINNKAFEKLVSNITEMSFSYTGTKGFDSAQVTAGGVSLEELSLKTMMINKPSLKGLYFIGEVCDVDGICGGYNLEWARTSAYLAAESIIHDSDRSN